MSLRQIRSLFRLNTMRPTFKTMVFNRFMNGNQTNPCQFFIPQLDQLNGDFTVHKYHPSAVTWSAEWKKNLGWLRDIGCTYTVDRYDQNYVVYTNGTSSAPDYIKFQGDEQVGRVHITTPQLKLNAPMIRPTPFQKEKKGEAFRVSHAVVNIGVDMNQVTLDRLVKELTECCESQPV